MSFIAYRDYTAPSEGRAGAYDVPGIDVCGFTEDIATLKGVVARQVASGGNDGPEDVCGGLREALALTWTAQKRHLFLVADAPCHGERYHDFADNYPAGDPTTPTGLVPEEQLEVLMAETGKRTQVHFMRLTKYTDKMVAVFNEHLEPRVGRGVNVVDLTSSGDALSDQFEACVTKEVSRDWVHRA